MKIKKGNVFLIFILLIMGIFVITAAVDKTKQWHSSDSNIKLIVDGSEKTLQTAIDNRLFLGSHVYSSPSLVPAGGHNVDSIWVSVKDGEMNLLQALSSTNRVCPASIPKTTYSSQSIPNPSHLATEIEISINDSQMSLQDAINSRVFCYSWTTNLTSCNASCGGGVRNTYCNHNGVQVEDVYCSFSGTKPSVSCNPQVCVWNQTSVACLPTPCGYVVGLSSCPTSPNGAACSPIGSTKKCGYGAGCTQGYGQCRVYTYTCQ